MVVVVTGMHRSGTSLTASIVERLGVDLGDDLLPADRRNPRGYFEDAGFLAFQRRVLRDAVPAGERGWPDWGWTEREVIDADVVAAAAEEARRIVDARAAAAAGRAWGWKDPRTSLLLAFWDGVVDDARYVLVYRPPWEVLDSIVRLHEGAFVSRPDWALRAWAFYNRALVEFAIAHRDRCVLFDVSAVVASPRDTVDLLVATLGLDADEATREAAAAAVEPALLRPPAAGHLLERLVRAASPAAVEILERLDAEADGAPRRRAPKPLLLDTDDATSLLVQWRAAEAERDRLVERIAGLEPELARVTEESEARHDLYVAKERESIERQREIERLEARLARLERPDDTVRP